MSCTGSSWLSYLNCGSGTALTTNSGITFNTLLAALGGSATSFGIQVCIFLLFRIRLAQIYRPRCHLVPRGQRVDRPPKGIIGWLKPVFTTENSSVIDTSGLDAFFFLRYLRMCLKIFLPTALVILPILLPLDRYSGGTQTGLDKLSISNVAPEHVRRRFWAQMLLAIGVTVWFCYVIYHELLGFIRVRQKHLTSPQHRIRASATTVLITGIPSKFLNREALSALYDVFPGGDPKHIWINRNFKKLAEKVKERKKVAKQLEAAETNLIKKCLAAAATAETAIVPPVQSDELVGTEMWRTFVDPKDRELMRLPATIPFSGAKVDKIDHLRSELARLNTEIDDDQAHPERFPLMNSAFVQFKSQIAAHMACQTLNHDTPKQMAFRQVEVSPEDVLWDNMSITWYWGYIRTALTIIGGIGLMFLYIVPVTFTSLLAKVNTLANQVSWLSWIAKLPTGAISIVQGVLPAILLSLILLIVPIILRAMITHQGVTTGKARELEVQKWYFAFLFIEVFFIVTLAGGLTAFIANIASSPGDTLASLAHNLPKAANYFFSYLLVQGLSNSASGLLQVIRLLKIYVWARMMDRTAHAKWKRETTLDNVQWGSFFPPFTTYATIGLIYSVIAPMILFFMLIIFSLYWVVYRYNVLFVYRFKNDTGGLLFPTALYQLFTGIYFMQLCLIGLFSISVDEKGKVACIPQAVILAVVLVGTALFHWQLKQTFDPLLTFLPITLEDDAVIRDEKFAEEHLVPLLARDSRHDDGQEPGEKDNTEAQRTIRGDALFFGAADELEELSAEDRDRLVSRAFLHSAMRARRPIIWLPSDELGIAADEIRLGLASHVIMSSDGAEFDKKGRVVVCKSPPDFAAGDLIKL